MLGKVIDGTTSVELLAGVDNKETGKALLGLYYQFYRCGVRRGTPEAKKVSKEFVLSLKEAFSDRILPDREAQSLEKGLTVLFFKFQIDAGTLDELKRQFMIIALNYGIERSGASGLFDRARNEYMKLLRQKELSEMDAGMLLKKYTDCDSRTVEIYSSLRKHTCWRGNGSSGEVLLQKTRLMKDSLEGLFEKYRHFLKPDSTGIYSGE